MEQFTYTQLVRKLMHTTQLSLTDIEPKKCEFSKFGFRSATRNVDNVNMDNIVSGDINKTGGLQKELETFNGARVMLLSNINIQQGLVNGTMGIITKIVWPFISLLSDLRY
ncbi:ATP-dependent DNA helicase [Trichonephila clavata]|uniref:ATP-dependent DNA helicase n=1 Tax=Trichonephila clavata TaxID=2740835 RepID=A0A8X6EXU5_TRICU|nr:ATP-dependent DNA helicase [Trichonephila clavata]